MSKKKEAFEKCIKEKCWAYGKCACKLKTEICDADPVGK